MNEVKIRDALNSVVLSMTLSQTLPVSWPAMKFDIPDDGKFIEVFRLPNDQQSITWGAKEELSRGVFRIGLHYPPDTGEAEPLALAAEIAAYFPKAAQIFYTGGKVELYDHPSIGAAIEDGQKRIYPISIRYQDYHKGA